MEIYSELEDYMFTTKNMRRFTKHIISKPNEKKRENKYLKNDKKNSDVKSDAKVKVVNTNYTPHQTDSLFWCFYILKNGYSKYEMDISGQYFSVEKNEKFKYITMLRQNKDKLKLHNIKPYTEIEDDLANKEKISIKTFFALCVLEDINVLLIDKRKVYELMCNDGLVNVVHKNLEHLNYYIETDANDEKVKHYKDTYYSVVNFETSLKSITYYKLDDLIELAKKLNIQINASKKQTKKDIYELLIMNY